MDDRIEYFKREYPEIFDGVDKVVDAKVEATLKEREVNTDQLIERKLREREFVKALNDAYPHWQQTWRMPEFQAFLQEEHELTGLPKYRFIEGHFRRLDSQAAIKFFNAFFSRGSESRASSFDEAGSSRTMSIDQARRELKELGIEKSRGLWKGRDAEFRQKVAALWKAIDQNG